MLRHDLPGGAYLRLLEEADAPELFALVDRNRAGLEPWLPWVPATRGPDDTLEFIRASRRKVADNDGLGLAIVDAGGAIAGVIDFRGVDWANRGTSIGYWLSEDAQGRGLVTAAVRALIDHAFDVWRLHRVEIWAAVDNTRSRAVAERLGLREEGVRRAAERHGERYLDLVVYAVLAADWPPPGSCGRRR